jgi:hypothetical protein
MPPLVSVLGAFVGVSTGVSCRCDGLRGAARPCADSAVRESAQTLAISHPCGWRNLSARDGVDTEI